MTRRSPFRRVPVLQQLGVFQSLDWKMDKHLLEWLESKHSVLFSSQLSEDAVKRVSKSEISRDNQPQSMERTWATLIECNALEKEHDLVQVDYASEADTRQPAIPPNTYSGNVADAEEKCNLKGIMEAKATSPWSNLPPDQVMFPEVDMELLEFLRKNNLDHSCCQKAILNGCLFRSCKIAFRAKNTSTWYLAMMDVGAMIICHPLKAEIMTKTGRVCYRISTDDGDRKLHSQFVIDATETRAFPCQFESPLETAHKEGFRAPELQWDRVGILIFSKYPTCSALEANAWEAFYDVNLPALRAVARHYLKNFPNDWSHFFTLRFMLMEILKVNDKDVLPLLQMPVVRNMVILTAFLDVEGATELFEPEEVAEMEHFAKKQMDKKSAAEIYVRQYEAERVRVWKPKPCTPTAARHPLHGVPTNRVYDPDGPEPSQQEAKLYLPPNGVSLWKGNPTRTKTGSWNAHYQPYPRSSRSWVAAGSERAALREVLQHVWRLWLRDRFLTVQDCPFRGIFE